MQCFSKISLFTFDGIILSKALQALPVNLSTLLQPTATENQNTYNQYAFFSNLKLLSLFKKHENKECGIKSPAAPSAK